MQNWARWSWDCPTCTFLPPCTSTTPGTHPLCLYGWPHRTTPAALARNRESVALFTQMLQASNAGIKAYAKRAGLNIDWEDPASTLSSLGVDHPSSQGL